MWTADLSEEVRQLLEYAEKIYGGWPTDLDAIARVLVAANLFDLKHDPPKDIGDTIVANTNEHRCRIKAITAALKSKRQPAG
jgi:hypothetical protein